MDSENTTVFDAKRTIALKLNTPEGVKTVRVRFPSDEEWTARQRRRKVIVKNLGRGMSETSVTGTEEIDAALVAKIRVEQENPVEVDAFEATRIVEQLSQAEVDDVVQAGGCFRVTTRVRATFRRRPGRSSAPACANVSARITMWSSKRPHPRRVPAEAPPDECLITSAELRCPR
jgi:hypothetical protein